MILPEPGSFWHIDAAQIVLVLSVLTGVSKMWFTLGEFPPHKHLNKRDGERTHEIGETIISYPRGKN